jgi:hypothetical protein
MRVRAIAEDFFCKNHLGPIQICPVDVFGGMRWQRPSDTLRFLRKTVIELRTIASTTPDVSNDLRRIASELEADADDLERRAKALQQQ